MTALIDFKDPVIQKVLPTLLLDHTTGENMMWATASYADRGEGFEEKDQMTAEKLDTMGDEMIQPRVYKALSE